MQSVGIIMKNMAVKGLSYSLTLLLFMAIQSSAFRGAPAAVPPPRQATDLVGRWKVKFSMMGLEKNLILISQANGVASFQLLDTGPEDKPVPDPQPAVWSRLTNDRVSFSGEAELPIGTCCREIGTIVFKGKFSSHNSISGKLVFVTSVDEDESPYKLRSVVGTFTATRLTK
jgi:hypothetical protein